MVLRRGPSKNPSVIRNNKDPQAPSLHLVSASLAIIYSCWRPSLVTMAKLSIHSGYLPGKRPPARGNHSSSPSPPPDRGKQTHAYEQPYRWWRYTPCLCTGYYTSTVCTPRVTLRPEIVPRSCKSSSTTTFLLTIAVSFLFHRILPLLANRDPLDHPSLPPLPPFVTDRGTEHSDSIQLGVERRRKIFLLDERLRSISISGFEDHFKLENSIF